MKEIEYKKLLDKKIRVVCYRYKKRHEHIGVLKDISPTHLCLEMYNEFGKKYNHWVFKLQSKRDFITLCDDDTLEGG